MKLDHQLIEGLSNTITVDKNNFCNTNYFEDLTKICVLDI